jgi:hypothetical protein
MLLDRPCSRSEPATMLKYDTGKGGWGQERGEVVYSNVESGHASGGFGANQLMHLFKNCNV